MGEISNAPRLGKNLLILIKMGSVILKVKSNIKYTNRLPVFKTLKATSQLITTLAITTYEYSFKIWSAK
tara:strand:- start:952 stop:1158 length:207 start_codon:yes stop_codon:yes gene_type:complete